MNYWEIKDPAHSARTDITRFHEAVPGATYQLECAVCHTSQQRFAGGVMEAKASSFREGGINCDMCHGPSAAHAAAMRAGRPYAKDPAEPPVEFQRIAATEFVAICAQCHMQTGLRDPEPSGALKLFGNRRQIRPDIGEQAVCGLSAQQLLQGWAIPRNRVHCGIVRALGLLPPRAERHAAIATIPIRQTRPRTRGR